MNRKRSTFEYHHHLVFSLLKKDTCRKTPCVMWGFLWHFEGGSFTLLKPKLTLFAPDALEVVIPYREIDLAGRHCLSLFLTVGKNKTGDDVLRVEKWTREVCPFVLLWRRSAKTWVFIHFTPFESSPFRIFSICHDLFSTSVLTNWRMLGGHTDSGFLYTWW